jgi:type II secretory pathway pseudopilin PulG
MSDDYHAAREGRPVGNPNSHSAQLGYEERHSATGHLTGSGIPSSLDHTGYSGPTSTSYAGGDAAAGGIGCFGIVLAGIAIPTFVVGALGGVPMEQFKFVTTMNSSLWIFNGAVYGLRKLADYLVDGEHETALNWTAVALAVTGSITIWNLVDSPEQQRRNKDAMQQTQFVEQQQKELRTKNEQAIQNRKVEANKRPVEAFFNRPFSKFFGTQINGNLCQAFRQYKAITCTDIKQDMMVLDRGIVIGTQFVVLDSKDGSKIMLRTKASSDGRIENDISLSNDAALIDVNKYQADLRNIAFDLLDRYGVKSDTIRACQAQPKKYMKMKINGQEIECVTQPSDSSWRSYFSVTVKGYDKALVP